MQLALIDGDSIVYICGFAVETKSYVIDGQSFSKKKEALEYAEIKDLNSADIAEEIVYEPLGNALQLVKNLLTKISTRTGCSKHRIFLSGQNNFREAIATIKPYKGNRPDRKPYWYDEIRKYLIEIKGAEVVQGIEADDALAMMATDNTVICTIDKDLDQVEGMHYNYQKDSLYDVSEDSALRSFYTQLLMGDPVDNIRGVPMIGKKKSRDLIKVCKDEEEMYWTCLNEYCKTHDKAYEALLENARLLYMLRHPNDEWEPPV